MPTNVRSWHRAVSWRNVWFSSAGLNICLCPAQNDETGTGFARDLGEWQECGARRPTLLRPGHQQKMLIQLPLQLSQCWAQKPWPTGYLIGKNFFSSERGRATLNMVIKQYKTVKRTNCQWAYIQILKCWEPENGVWEVRGGLEGRAPVPSDGVSSSRVTSSATSSATVSGLRPWVLMKTWACLHRSGCW
jgi:hypothetical protein